MAQVSHRRVSYKKSVYMKNEQGGGGSKNYQIWANVLFEWPQNVNIFFKFSWNRRLGERTFSIVWTNASIWAQLNAGDLATMCMHRRKISHFNFGQYSRCLFFHELLIFIPFCQNCQDLLLIYTHHFWKKNVSQLLNTKYNHTNRMIKFLERS